MKKVTMPKWAIDIFCMFFGCFITAFSVNAILKPNGLVTSGLTGVAIMLEKFTGINYSYIYYIFTLIVLICTLLLMGKREVLKIIVLSILYPGILILLQQFDFKFVENDLLLACIYFSALNGIGLGMILKRGFSLGGTDTISKILNKKFIKSISISNWMLILDGTVIICSAFVFGRNIAMYSLINQIITTQVIDYIMFGFGNKLYKLHIISNCYDELSKYIMHQIGRGVTLHSIEGGYTNQQRKQLVTVCSPKESLMIRQFIVTIDPTAYVEVMPIISVWGIGNRFVNIKEDK